MLDPNEFLGDHGIRSLSRFHRDNPYIYWNGSQEYRVGYLPAESDSGMFGGNSNWRGPVWAPINALIVRGLLNLYAYYGDEFKVECPTGSGHHMTLYQVAEELANRLSAIFLRDHEGRRPVYGGTKKFDDDPRWRDHVLFYEYFHGDNGAGLGASHQTGWTAIIPALTHLFGMLTPEMILKPDSPLAELSRREREAEDALRAPGATP
jgi:Mannosylglycerate hydrolase MGH1-like glycoside hydrolase domain